LVQKIELAKINHRRNESRRGVQLTEDLQNLTIKEPMVTRTRYVMGASFRNIGDENRENNFAGCGIRLNY